MSYEVHRSALFGWLVGLLSVPLVLIGFDVLVLPKVVPGYGRFIDRLAELTRLNSPGANGSEEAWALVFSVVGTAMLIWSTKEMFAPRPVLKADPSGLTFNALGGPAAGTVFLPWDEVSSIEAVVLEDADGDVPALRVRVGDARRLPSHPWGGEWVDGSLVLRANAWSEDPVNVARSLKSLSMASLPPPPEESRIRFGRVAWGLAMIVIGLILGTYVLLSGGETENWPLIPIAGLIGLGLLWIVAGFRSAFDDRFSWMFDGETS